MLSFLVTLAAVVPAQSPNCADLPNPVFLQVGDTQEPIVKKLGQALRNSTVNPMTLIYVTSGSCSNIEAIYTDVPITTNPKYVPSAEEDAAWTPSSPSPTCTASEGGHPLDIANSALFVSACDPNDPPPGIGLFQGPVQAYLFIVPEASSQVAITAEEAYFVFGFGDQGQVTPWNDEAFMFIRPTTKSTLLTLAANIGVPGAKWQGVPYDKSSEVLNAVATSSSPEKTIGIMGSEIYDANRTTVNGLAFQGYQQNYAYYPDSTSTAFDKANVRDGHYLPWAPTVWLTQVDDDGIPVNPRAKYVIDLLLGLSAEPTPDFDATEIVIGAGLVPDCAMSVVRSYEGGPLSLYDPVEPCGCFYESKVATTACTECSNDDDCGGGACRHGYCEER